MNYGNLDVAFSEVENQFRQIVEATRQSRQDIGPARTLSARVKGVFTQFELQKMAETRAITTAAKVSQIILLIHGINDFAMWQDMVTKILKEDERTKMKGIKYGYFDVVRFLSPIDMSRRPLERSESMTKRLT